MGCCSGKSVNANVADVVPPVNPGGDTDDSNTVLDPPAPNSPKPDSHNGEEVGSQSGEEAASQHGEEIPPALKIAVLAVEGLPASDGLFVEVEIEGQADSKVKTPAVSGRFRTHGVAQYARTSVEADIKCEFSFKEYAEGAGITFTVMDSDPAKTEPLGRVTLPGMMVQTQFWGKIPLTCAGGGHEAALEVRVGDRHILVETAQEITNALSDAAADIQEAVTEGKAGIDDVVGKTTEKVEKGVADASVKEVKTAVSNGLDDAAEIAEETVGVSKRAVVDNAVEIKEVVTDAWDEVKETKGSVCCRC